VGLEVCHSVAAPAEPMTFAEALRRPDAEQWDLETSQKAQRPQGHRLKVGVQSQAQC